MKKLSFCFSGLLCFLLFSCTQPTVAPADTSKNDEAQKMISMNEQVYRAIESGNFDGIDTLIADDMVDHDAHTGANVKGKDSVIAMLKGVHSMYKDIKFTTLASAYDAEHGYVMTLVEITGTSMQADQNMPANTPFHSKSVDVVQVKNGKAVEHWEYTDPIEMMKMMPEHK